MTALTEVIDTSMADTRTAENRVGSVEHDFLIGLVEPANAVLTGFDVTHIAVMSDFLARTSMSQAFRVPVRTSRRTSIAQVTYRRKAI